LYYQQNKTLHRIKELKCVPPLKTIHFDMIKSAVGMFMAEVIHKTVRDENHIDTPLFSFLYNSIQILDLQTEAVGNYPLYFLIQLSRYLGFFPKGIYSETTNGFDTREGIFEVYDARNPFQLSPNLSQKVSNLLHASAATFHEVQLGGEERRLLLEVMIDYYREHITDFFDMKSHKVLAEVLA
jgi:DNA repair protein RecO (recombination protein O)